MIFKMQGLGDKGKVYDADKSENTHITFTDVDGAENGGEFSKVEFDRDYLNRKAEKVEDGEGWYMGKFNIELGDVEMTLVAKDNAEETPEE